jgi:hypothetical protein
MPKLPKPDDPSNLDNNLYTLTRLLQSPEGSKLSYDRGTGRFSIQKPGALQGLARTLSHDTITSEEYFGGPIRAVLSAAYPGRYRVGSMFNTALDGLRSLRQSYAGNKRAALDAVISDAEHGTNKDTRGSIRLRKEYKSFLIFGFQQAMFLPSSHHGICYALTIDWGRRILGGKASFAMSSKQDRVALKTRTTFDAEQKARMMKKVDSRVRDLQAGILKTSIERGVQPRKAFELIAPGRQFGAKYGNLRVFPCVTVPQAIAADAAGRGVLADVRRAARERLGQDGSRIFIVNFKCKIIGAGGHAIGIHLPGDGLHFFDPNIGEFWFPEPASRKQDAFLDDWWESFYIELSPPDTGLGRNGELQDEQFPPTRQFFESWKLEGIENIR